MKLFIDRSVMIRRVAPDGESAEALIEALDKYQAQYFGSAIGFDSIVEIRPGQGRDGWCNGFYESYELNEAGKAYQTGQLQGTSSRPDVHQVMRCLRELKQRADSRWSKIRRWTPTTKKSIDAADRVTPCSIANLDFWMKKDLGGSSF